MLRSLFTTHVLPLAKKPAVAGIAAAAFATAFLVHSSTRAPENDAAPTAPSIASIEPAPPATDPNALPADPCEYTVRQAGTAFDRPIPEDDGERLRLVTCVASILQEPPKARTTVLTPAQYLEQYGATAEQITSISNFLPQNFTIIREDTPHALTLMTSLAYIHDEAAGHDPDEDYIINHMGVLGRLMPNNYFNFSYGREIGGTQGGFVFAPIPNVLNNEIMNVPLNRPHMLLPTYAADMNLMISLHEFGHTHCSRDAAAQLTTRLNHFETCSDIYGTTVFSILRGNTSPALNDYVQWRAMGSINLGADARTAPDNMVETHGTSLILESYLRMLPVGSVDIPLLLNNISNVATLTDLPAFRRYNEGAIVRATNEAFALMQTRGLDQETWQARTSAAQQVLSGIDDGTIPTRYPITREIVENYLEGMIYWYTPQATLTLRQAAPQ